MKKSASSPRGTRGKKKKERIVRYTADTLPEPTKEAWERFHSVRDKDIDDSDIPELDEKFWKNARLMPTLIHPAKKVKTPVSLRIDPDILDWFKKHGRYYQSRINAVLRAYVQSKEL